jgi:tetratricopeptide (TPR) repeat protein
LIFFWINYLRFPVYLWPALRLSRQKKTGQAIQKVDEILRARPESWAAQRLRYDLDLANMQFAEAERDARLMVKLKPVSSEARSLLFMALFNQGSYEDAKFACEEALKVKPRDACILYDLGICYYRLGETSRCIEIMSQVTRKSLPLNLYSLIARYYLGRSLETAGQPEAAMKAYREMHRFADDLKKHIQRTNAYPDHPEIILFRSDLLDIEQRLSKI